MSKTKIVDRDPVLGYSPPSSHTEMSGLSDLGSRPGQVSAPAAQGVTPRPTAVLAPFESGPSAGCSSANTLGVDEIFAHYLAGWRQAIGGTRPPRLDQKRKRLLQARLREFSASDLKLAIDGVWRSEFHLRSNHYGIELIMRDTAHVERFRALATGESRAIEHRLTGRFCEYWRERYKRVYGREYTLGSEDRNLASQVIHAAEEVSCGAGDERIIEIVKHWVRCYLQENGEGGWLAEGSHLLKHLPKRLGPYGLPPARQLHTERVPPKVISDKPNKPDEEAEMREAKEEFVKVARVLGRGRAHGLG